MITILKRYFHSAFYRMMIFYFIPVKQRCYITVSGKTDGMGAQAQAVFSGMLFASALKKKYVHTPLKKVAHNYENDKLFERKVEDFFSFNLHEDIINKAILNKCKTINLNSSKEIIEYIALIHFFQPLRHVIFQDLHFHFFADRNPQLYRQFQTKLREKFYATLKIYPLHKTPDTITIAVHIRRGDVTPNNAYLFLNNSEHIEKLNNLIAILNPLKIPYNINIYSEGAEEDFSDLRKFGSLHVNEDAFESFYNMVEADILLTTRSSFSYTAALLSKGIILYEPFWHMKLHNWLTYSKDQFSEEELTNKLKSAFTFNN